MAFVFYEMHKWWFTWSIYISLVPMELCWQSKQMRHQWYVISLQPICIKLFPRDRKLYCGFPFHSGVSLCFVLKGHDDVIKWQHFPRYWPFVRGIYRSPVNSPHKGQWRGAVMFSLIYALTNGWATNRDAGDLSRHRAHHDVTVMT